MTGARIEQRAEDRDGWTPQGPVVELSADHSWTLLGQASFGRLAVSVDNQPAIFPLDYACDGHSILFRTSEGTKLRDLLRNNRVSFEADKRVQDESWSVIVEGTADILHDPSDIANADSAALPEWVPTAPPVYVRISPTSIHGRRFVHSVLAQRSPAL